MAGKKEVDWRTDPRFLDAATKLISKIEKGKREQAKKGGK